MAEDSEESRRALDRVARDSETVGASSLRRMSGHFAARDAVGAGEGGKTDPIELWGRRIGRFLSVIGVVALSLWLLAQLKLL
jgi:hypothetical protein